MILDEIKNQQFILQELKPFTKYSEKEEIVEDFQQAWHEAMTGQAIPVSQLWEEMSEQFIQIQISQVFRQNLKTLAKKNRNIQKDVPPIVEQLSRGEALGDRCEYFGISQLGQDIIKIVDLQILKITI